MNKYYITAISAFAFLTTGCNFFSSATPNDGRGGGGYASMNCQQPLGSTVADKIVVDKSDRRMYLYKNGSEIASFRVSLGANDYQGEKVQKGDKRTPIGTYTILNKRCHPVKYMAMTISYPNASDRAKAATRGVHPGSLITIHGQPEWNSDGHGDSYTLSRDWTDGCIALTNSGMRKLWSMIRVGTPITLRH